MTFVAKSNGKGNKYVVNDDIMTPEHIARFLISLLPIRQRQVLYDPFRGSGAFYDNFPSDSRKVWSEIKEAEDFFDFHAKVDWIISNPPYSKYTEVMQHSYEIADNIAYLIPLNKIVSSWGRVIDMKKYGGVRKIWILQASTCGFPFGFPACFVWIKKGYRGATSCVVLDNLTSTES